MKKRLLSLFSGCGGMDLGFEGGFKVYSKSINTEIHSDWIEKQNGSFVNLKETCFETVFANDISKSAKLAWTKYFTKKGKNDVFHLESIVDLVKKYNQGEFNFPDNIDILTGGFPCQDFSLAGKRKGFNSHKSHNGELSNENEPNIENRGLLYTWMREVISIVKPKIFIAENVKGLVSLGEVREIIENDFKNIDKGYFVLPSKVLNACDFGVSQNRERIIFIGISKRFITEKAYKIISSGNIPYDYDPYPPSTHSKFYSNDLFNTNTLLPYVTLKEILNDLNEPEEEKFDLSQQNYSKAKYYGKLQGNIEINLEGVSPTIRSEHHGNIEFRRLSTENGGKYINELNEGKKERRLTVRECARIQTFPDDYELVINSKNKEENISASSAYKIIGNAVPPLLAYNISKKLELIWDNLFDLKEEKLIKETNFAQQAVICHSP
jgi:DNA (cytosine-5)-methyltransferase 1